MFIIDLGKLLFLIGICFSVCSSAQIYKPPPQSAQLLEKVDFSKARQLDKNYKAEFDACDKPGKKCASDPNNLKALLRFGDDAVFFDSKMALDLDGSFVGCNCGNNMGLVDQCSTSYFWKNFPNDYSATPKKDRCKFYQDQFFVDSNKIPYIVIPGGFEAHFKLSEKPYKFIDNSKGTDLGVVIYKDKLIPVMVADSGPGFRIGEGSAALFRAIGEERCKTFQQEQCTKFKDFGISKNVLFFVFPNSRISKDKLNKDNALGLINKEAMKRFNDFKIAYNRN